MPELVLPQQGSSFDTLVPIDSALQSKEVFSTGFTEWIPGKVGEVIMIVLGVIYVLTVYYSVLSKSGPTAGSMANDGERTIMGATMPVELGSG